MITVILNKDQSQKTLCNYIYMMTKNWQNQSMADRNQKQDTLGWCGWGRGENDGEN